MRTAADLTPIERAREYEQAISLVEDAINELLETPKEYAGLALRTAVANWTVSTESFAFLEGRYIDDISTVDSRLAEAHRKMASFASEHGIELEAINQPTIAYLRKLEVVEPYKARIALVPLLSDRTLAKAEVILLEVDHWLLLAEKNGADLTQWSALVNDVASILRQEFPSQADQLEALYAKCRGRSLAGC